MNTNVSTRKRLLRSNSFIIPLLTSCGLLVFFLLYIFWYVSAEEKYYNDRAFRVLAVLSGAFERRITTIGSVLGASTAYDGSQPRQTRPREHSSAQLTGAHGTGQPDATIAPVTREHTQTAEQYVASYLEGYGVTPEKVTPLWGERCDEAARNGALRLELDDPGSFSPKAIYSAPDVLSHECPNHSGEITISTVVQLDVPLRALFEELNEGFFEEELIADSDGQVFYQQSTGGVRISDLNDLVRLRPDGSSVVTSPGKPETTATPPEKEKGKAEPKERPFAVVSGSARVIDIELAGAPYRLYLQPSTVSISKKFKSTPLIFCGLRTAKHAQADTMSLPNTAVIWGTLVLLLVFALGWPLLKIFYVSPKERMSRGQLLALVLTILAGTALMTLLSLNWSYTSTQEKASELHLENVAKNIKFQAHTEIARALEELNRVSPELAPLSGRVRKGDDSWQIANYFQQKQGQVAPAAQDDEPYPYFRYAVLIDADGWQRAKFTADAATPRVNAQTERYFQEIRRGNAHQFIPTATDSLPRPTLFRLDLTTSPNTGDFLPILSIPYARPALGGAPARVRQPDVTSPLIEKLLVMTFASLVDPVLPPGFGFAVIDPAGKVQFHSISHRNLIEDFLKETQSNPELLALLEQGGSDFFHARYLGSEQLLYVTPLELSTGSTVDIFALVVFRDEERATAGNKAVVVVYGLLATAYLVVLWGIAVIYFSRPKIDYPLQSMWPTVSRQESYLRIATINLILFSGFLVGYRFPPTYPTLYLAIALGAIALLSLLGEHEFFDGGWKYGIRALPFGYLLALLHYTRGSHLWAFYLLLLLITVLVFSHHFSRQVYSLRQDTLHSRMALKHTYSAIAISLLLSAVVAPCIGFFKFAFETVERRTTQVDQIELARQLDRREDRIGRYFDRIHAADSLTARRRAEKLDRHDLAFFNCFTGQQGGVSGGEILNDNRVEEWMGDVAELIQSRDYAGLLELERAHEPREFHWQVFTKKAAAGATSDNCAAWISLESASRDPVVSPLPLWGGFTLAGKGILVLSILLLTAWLYVITRRIFLIGWRESSELEVIDVSDGIRRSTVIIGHPKSGKSGMAQKASRGYSIDIAAMAATGQWKPTLAAVPVIIILDHFEYGMDDAALNMKKLELLERLVYVERRTIIILCTLDPLFYLISGFPNIVSTDPGKESASVQVRDRWASILSVFYKGKFEDKTSKQFDIQLGKMQEQGKNSPALIMLINVVREECNHTAILRRIGLRLLPPRVKQCAPTNESCLREEIMEDVLDRADAYYRSLWSTCTEDERLVLYQLAKDGWANPKNSKAIQELKRRRLIFWSSGFRMMNKSFRQFVLDYQYPEDLAAWNNEIRQSTWRAVRSSMVVAGALLVVWLVYSQQQVVHVAVGYVGVIGGAAATVAGLVSSLRNRGAKVPADGPQQA
jgi:hypothetical protein